MKSFVTILLVLLAISNAHGISIYGADEINDDPVDNTCTYYAQTSDLSTAGIVSAISSQCKTLLGSTPNSIVVNDDTYPYKMCLFAGNATWANLQPADDESVVASDNFNNTTNQNVTHEFSLEGEYVNSLQISTTSAVSFSAGVNFNVDVLPIFKMKFDMNTSFSSSKETTQFSKEDITFQSSTTVNCLPSCDYTAQLNVQSQLYKANFQVPICLTGWARCTYNSKVNGHYFWYVLIDDFIADASRCVNQNGALASAVSVDSTTTLSKICSAN
jgi:hypothetical protein